MLIRTLNQKHPEYDGELWLDYEALYKSGNQFSKRIRRFLIQNPQEPDETYLNRQKEASFRSYLGTIVDYFSALLFSVQIIYKPTIGPEKAEVEAPEWVQHFVDDVDGRGSDLSDFLRTCLVDACVKRKSFWLLDFPENYGKASTKLDAERSGASNVKLRMVGREQVIDWGKDKRGKLAWAIIREEDAVRYEPEETRDSKVISWTVVDRKRLRRFEVEVALSESPNQDLQIEPVFEVEHEMGEVPLVELDVEDGMWIANRVAMPQIEHFRLSAANNWSMKRTAYAMPVLHLEDPEGFRPGRMGAGYFLMLRTTEKFDWAAPPSQHFSAVTEEVRNQKDEIFRLVTQMSLGVDNNSAAIGRSAESKIVDAEAIQVILRTYANKVRDRLKLALNLLSRARGEQHEWTVEGLDRFETLSPDVLVALLKEAIGIGIPSQTFMVEAKCRVANALLPGLDSTSKQTIREEIQDGVESEEDNGNELLEIARRVGSGTQGGSEEDRRSGGNASAPADELAEENGSNQRPN
jgi:hypothetical protein